MNAPRGADDPLYRAVEERMRRHCGRAPDGHRCTPTECFRGAESEWALVQRGLLPGPATTCNVFLTRCRTIHLCSETACTLYGADPTGTCPISGAQYGVVVSSYDRNDARTWYSRPALETAATASGTGKREREDGGGGGDNDNDSQASRASRASQAKKPPRRQVAEPLGAEEKAQRASNLVRLLLWSPKRVTRNEHVLRQLEESAQTACDNYVALQRAQGQPPIWTDLFRVRGNMMAKQTLLQVLVYDEALHDYYVAILTQVWDRAVRFHVRGPRPVNAESLPRREFDCVALAALYGMRQGAYHREGVSVLPKDEFLARELPCIFDLEPYFGVRGDLITRGQKILRQALDNAFDDHVPHGEIELDMAQLTSAAASGLNGGGGGGGGAGVGVMRDARNRQVKITNKGEVLFMPVSRKKPEPPPK